MRTEAAVSEIKTAIMKFTDAAEADSTALRAALRDLRADAKQAGEFAPTQADIDAWSVRALTLLNQVERLLVIVNAFQADLTDSRDQMATFLGARRVN